MKQGIITGLFLLLSFLGFSQGENNIWYFGKRAGLDFNSGSPVALTNCSPAWDDYSFMETATVSDSLGSLLFYSNYEKVFDRNHNMMPNGNISASTPTVMQPVFVVNKMDEDSSYYLFTMDDLPNPSYPNPKGLRYSVIDMRLNGGFGNIVSGQKNIPVLTASQTAIVLTGTRHHNNRDVWLVVREYLNSYSYLTYHITSTGINPAPVVSNSFLLTGVGSNWYNRPVILKFSPDGEKLLCTYDSIAEFCNFNSETGVITPLFLFQCAPPFCGFFRNGVEFSIDSKFLYIQTTFCGPNPWKIVQFDATKTDSTQFKQSEILIAYDQGKNDLRLAPDGKIYITDDRYVSGPPWPNEGVDSLAVINNPSAQGLACNYQANAFYLNGRRSYSGFPQFLQKYKAYIHHTGFCQNDSFYFSNDIWPPPDSIHWDFGDPASGAANYSNLLEPSHLFSGPGNFTVEMWVRHIDKRTDTSWVVVNVPPAPDPVLGEDRTICTGDSVTFDAGYFASCTYLWRNLVTGLPVGTDQTFTTKIAGIYEVAVTDINDCIGRDTVQLSITPIPVVTNVPLFKAICTGDSTDIVLTSNAPGVNFYWTASLTSGNVTGFSADSGLVINQVLVNYNPSPGMVTYHITPKVGSCIGTPSNYAVTVNPGDSVKILIAASVNNVCAGTQVTFTATPVNGGSNPVYQWKVNAVNSGTNSPIFIYAPNNGNLVQCVLTSSNTVCTSNNPATSNTITMIVNPNLPISISVSVSGNPVCAGTGVTFTATPNNGGTTPQYQWKVNGGNVGTNNPVYTYVPANGDLVWCILTSSEVCTSNNPASSIQHQMVVNPLLPVSVTISASSNPFCTGNSVTFTATHANGGSSPSYQWNLNGANVSIDTIYTYYPVNGDIVSCVITSSASCVTGNPATSNTITMIGTPGLPAGVSINAIPNPFCPGSSVTCTASPVNGGTNPVYQWKVNGINVGTNSPTHTFNPLNNDSVRCVMTSSLSCVSGNPATSNKIILSGTLAPMVTFTRCFDSVTTLNAKPIKLKGGIPLGGNYTGTGVNSTTGVFTPSTAGIGTKTITYTYTNVALCSASKTKTIVVQSAQAFTCGNNMTDIRDGKVYPTIQFGSQCWMAANLNYGTMILSSLHQRDNCIPEKYCFNDLTGNCELGTANYQWDELMRYDDTPGLQGLCPPGWHVPTEADWNILFANWTNNAFAGAPLKYSGYSGFDAILSGVRHLNVQWDYRDFATFFWSSTPYGAYKAWAHGMNDYDPSVAAYPALRSNAFSIRCLRD